MRRTVVVCAAASSLFSCAVASPIRLAATSSSAFWFPGWGKSVTVVSEVPEEEQFRISHRGSTGYTPVSALRRSAHRRAEQFCQRSDRVLSPVTEQQSSPPHILGNFPRYEMVFACTHADLVADPEDPYDRLKRFKDLLDDQVISQDEFEREKHRILNP